MASNSVSANQATRYKVLVISKNSLDDYTQSVIGQEGLAHLASNSVSANQATHYKV